MFPFEFIIEGPPVSAQTRNRENLRRWKEKVKDIAINHWDLSNLPSNDQLKITITYYYETDSPDVDNIIKPIQDALIGVVFQDDRQITDTTSRKRDINSAYKIRGMSKFLAEGFCTGVDFLHIKVEIAKNFEELGI